jgi:hypothetical protein
MTFGMSRLISKPYFRIKIDDYYKICTVEEAANAVLKK